MYCWFVVTSHNPISLSSIEASWRDIKYCYLLLANYNNNKRPLRESELRNRSPNRRTSIRYTQYSLYSTTIQTADNNNRRLWPKISIHSLTLHHVVCGASTTGIQPGLTSMQSQSPKPIMTFHLHIMT